MHRAAAAFPLALIAATAAALAIPPLVGFVPLGLYGTDYVFIAEGAQRIALGQVPHVDFSLPVGRLTMWLTAVARRLPWLGPDLFVANTLAWLMLVVPVAIVGARLSTPRAVLLVAVAALAPLSPFDLELASDLCAVNHNGVYNRFGAAFLVVTFAAGLAPPARSRWTDAALYAWLVAAMILLKINYALAGIAFLALASLFSRRRAASFVVAAVILVLAAGVLQVATGIPSAYARDVAEMARLNGGNAVPFLLGFASSQIAALLVAAAALLSLLAKAWRMSAPQRSWRELAATAQTPVLAAAIVALTLWTESQSTGGVGLLAWSAVAFAPGLGGRWTLAAVAALATMTAGAYAEQTLRRGRCVAASLSDHRPHPALAALGADVRAPAGRLAEAEALARLWRDDRTFAETVYNKAINFGLEAYGAAIPFVATAILAEEAAAVVRARGIALKSVTTLDVVDHFTPRLGLTPARGLKLFLDPYRTIGPLSPDDAQRYLAPVDGVFERTCAAPEYDVWLADTFRPALSASFERIALTPCWTLHRRLAR
jgi:hypothetical protein